MTKPSASLPVLYARVPVETYALAQLLSGAGKTSLSQWICDLIEAQRGTLGGQPLPPYAQPAKRAFTFAFNNAHTREAQQAAVRLADWVLRSPDIRNGLLTRTLWELSHPACAGEARVDIDVSYQTRRALDLMQDMVVTCPNGVKAQVFEVTMSIDPLPESQVVICLGPYAAEIWDEHHHAWWEMVRALPRILTPQHWADVDAHEAKTQRAIAVASANERAELEPAVAAVAPVKRGRGRPRKVVATDREDGHQRAADAAYSSGDDQ